MDTVQFEQLMEILTAINDKLDWLETIASWVAYNVSVLIPLICLVIWFWWVIRQFADKYY